MTDIQVILVDEHDNPTGTMEKHQAHHLGLRHPGRFCAVGGHSAGLWLDESEEFEGAFDNRADYERNDVLAAVRRDGAR